MAEGRKQPSKNCRKTVYGITYPMLDFFVVVITPEEENELDFMNMFTLLTPNLVSL